MDAPDTGQHTVTRAVREQREVTLAITVSVPPNWTEGDINDALRFNLDIGNLTDQDVDWYQMDVVSTRLLGGEPEPEFPPKVMPTHTVSGVGSGTPICRGAQVEGYVMDLGNGDLHCNRCGWVWSRG